MSEHIQKAIEELAAQLLAQERKVTETKVAINTLCKVLGQPIRYASVEAEKTEPLSSLKPDQFFGKSLSGAVKAYLSIRGSSATVDEIYDALSRGGYDFSGKDQKKNLRISMTKNSAMFAYVKKSDTFGLWEWYGGKPSKAKKEEESEAPETPNPFADYKDNECTPN